MPIHKIQRSMKPIQLAVELIQRARNVEKNKLTRPEDWPVFGNAPVQLDRKRKSEMDVPV